MARFLMNTMLASGNYPWTVIPVERRKDYMTALEEASVNDTVTISPSIAPILCGLITTWNGHGLNN